VSSLLSAAPSLAASAFKAKVATSQNVNLKLRALPSGRSSAVGLLPSGTVLDVYGIAVTDVSVNVPISESASTANKQVLIDQVWLYVEYQQESTLVTGWVNARYVSVTDPRGHGLNLSGLLALPRVDPNQRSNGSALPAAQNSASVAITSATTASAGQSTTYVVANLNANAHLSLREQPNSTSKRLALLPIGTVLNVAGKATDAAGNKWLYVSVAVEGATLEGYVTAIYVSANTTPTTVSTTTNTSPNSATVSNSPTTSSSVTTGPSTVITTNTTPSKVSSDEPPVVNVVP